VKDTVCFNNYPPCFAIFKSEVDRGILRQTLTMGQETQPLLGASSDHIAGSHSTLQTHDNTHDELPALLPDILPGSTYRKSLNWSSAYILVVSRVIGSGIFATPGSIVKSAGSIGLTLLVWLVGTILSACGLAVSMEYGCMLPRSGGEKVKQYHL
jgi:amino acid permease